MDKPAGGGPPVERKVFDFKCPGVAMGMHNRDDQIKGFAHSCFNFAYQRGWLDWPRFSGEGLAQSAAIFSN